MTTVICDGRPLAATKAELILFAAGLEPEHAALVAQGYVLQPIAAPRALDGGGIRFRLTWRRRVGSLTSLVRHTVTLRPPAQL